MSEILAPAGDKISAMAAINAGADAIYLGLKEFSARSSAENFDLLDFKETVALCHAFGVKAYVAMNTLIKDAEIKNFLSSALCVWNSGVDALIVSDVFLGKFLKLNYPDMVLHLSTQAGACNAYAALLAKEYGFSRVILSRETSLDDIREIAKIIETEVFVQGALCTCFSGQCYLSSFAGGNSGNRGRCKQPCRKRYGIDREGFGEESYKLSLSDLSVGEEIETLRVAGVFSFKIEGRMRRPEYVSAAVRYYREILNGKDGSAALSDLKRTYNRGNYTKGLAFGQDKNFISSAVQGHIGEFVGVVKVENGKYVCLSRQSFVGGDGFKILRDGKELCGAAFAGKVKGGFVLSSGVRLKSGDKVFVTTDTSLNRRLLAERRTIKVEISAKFSVGELPEVFINGRKVTGDKAPCVAQNRPLTVEDVKNCFLKTDRYPFEVTFGKIKTGNVFVPASELNAFRRTVFADYFEHISGNKNTEYVESYALPSVKCGINGKTAVISTCLNGVCADIGILKPDDYSADLSEKAVDFKGLKYLYLPPYLTGGEIREIKNKIPLFDGIYCEGIYGIKLAEEINKPLFAGFGFNLSNRIDVSYCPAEHICLSKELTLSEIKEISAENAFYLAGGDIKVMDIIYCPFEKTCKTCDKRSVYTLTDEEGRSFPLRRYKTLSSCRFELYNCVPLSASAGDCGAVIDCTLSKNAAQTVETYKNKGDLQTCNYTRGHSQKPVL